MEFLDKNLIIIAITLYAIYFIFVGIKVVNEDERIALLKFGKFDKIIGPGLNLVTPSQAKQIERIYLGQEGEYLGGGIARFNNVAMPVTGEGVNSGSLVRINSFQENKIHIQYISSNEVTCPHCHKTFNV